MGLREVILADRPLAYWRLGEDSGSAHNSAGVTSIVTLDMTVASGSPLKAAGGLVVGDNNHGRSFGGSDWMNCNNAALTPDGSTGAMAVEAIVSPSGSASVTNDIVTDWPFAWILRLNTSLVPVFYTYDGSSATSISGSALATGQRAHLIGAYDAGGSQWLFVNGVLVAGPTAGSVPRHNGGDLYLCNQSDILDSTVTFRGTVSDVAFYNHWLGPASARRHYLAGLDQGYGLGWWKPERLRRAS